MEERGCGGEFGFGFDWIWIIIIILVILCLCPGIFGGFGGGFGYNNKC